MPDPVFEILERDLVAPESYVPADLQRDIMYLLHSKKVKQMIRPVKQMIGPAK